MLLERQHNNKHAKYVPVSDYVAPARWIYHVPVACKEAVLQFFFLFGLSSKCTMIFVRIELNIFWEKGRVCVDADFCMSTLPWNILEAQKMQFGLISCFHRDAIVFYFLLDTMLIRWRCEGYTMSCCLPNTIGQHRVSIVLPSCTAKLSRWCRWPHDRSTM